jgi:hypothetical protein
MGAQGDHGGEYPQILKKIEFRFVYNHERLHFGIWSSWGHISNTSYLIYIGSIEGKGYNLCNSCAKRGYTSLGCVGWNCYRSCELAKISSIMM